MAIRFFDLQAKGDDRGALAVIEGAQDIPFEIKRVYYIYDTKMNVRRGFHAHKNLEQIAVCVSGKCCFHLDDGVETAEVLLDSPLRGLYVGKMIWREMYDFSPDCVLMVIASEHYSEGDYIRDYGKFKKMVTR